MENCWKKENIQLKENFHEKEVETMVFTHRVKTSVSNYTEMFGNENHDIEFNSQKKQQNERRNKRIRKQIESYFENHNSVLI